MDVLPTEMHEHISKLLDFRSKINLVIATEFRADILNILEISMSYEIPETIRTIIAIKVYYPRINMKFLWNTILQHHSNAKDLFVALNKKLIEEEMMVSYMELLQPLPINQLPIVCPKQDVMYIAAQCIVNKYNIIKVSNRTNIRVSMLEEYIGKILSIDLQSQLKKKIVKLRSDLIYSSREIAQYIEIIDIARRLRNKKIIQDAIDSIIVPNSYKHIFQKYLISISDEPDETKMKKLSVAI